MKTPKILKNMNQESIGYLESSINYTLFYLQDGKSILSAYNMKVFEKLLNNDDFIKINRSNLVNVSFIQKALIEKSLLYPAFQWQCNDCFSPKTKQT